MKDFSLEDEITFAFDQQKLDPVLDAIWPNKEYINVDGITFWRRSSTISRTIHFYVKPKRERDKCRIKSWQDGKKLRFACDEKTYDNGSKFERSVWISKGKKALKNLRKSAPVIGVLAKERVSLHYRAGLKGTAGIQEQKLKASIDRIFLLDKNANKIDSKPLYHLDLEGDGKGLQNLFASSQFFHRHLSDVIEPLKYEDSKWLLASKHLHEPINLGEMAYDDIASFVQRGLSVF